jgi:hypothetical protein
VKLQHKACILFRAARVYVMGTYHEGLHRSAPTWRDAVAVALCEDVKASISKPHRRRDVK